MNCLRHNVGWVFIGNLHLHTMYVKYNLLRLLGKAFETDGTAEKPSCQQTTLCDIQINIKYYRQIYV